jgi:hypothetical protein
MNAKAKSRRNKHRSMALLEAAGYRCTRSAGSLGEWDIIGIGRAHVVLRQVKTGTGRARRSGRCSGCFRPRPGKPGPRPTAASWCIAGGIGNACPTCGRSAHEAFTRLAVSADYSQQPAGSKRD